MRKIVWTILLSVLAFYAAAHIPGQTATSSFPLFMQPVVSYSALPVTLPGLDREPHLDD